MSNYFILCSNHPLKTDLLKIKKIDCDKQLGVTMDMHYYELLPLADVEKTVENEKVPFVYDKTCEFFNKLHDICKNQLDNGYCLSILFTFYGKDKILEHPIIEVNFPISKFFDRYLCFEFNTIYRCVLS